MPGDLDQSGRGADLIPTPMKTSAPISRKQTGESIPSLEPAIIQSILAGQQPKCMSLLWFQRNPLPTDWVAQREVVVGFDA